MRDYAGKGHRATKKTEKNPQKCKCFFDRVSGLHNIWKQRKYFAKALLYFCPCIALFPSELAGNRFYVYVGVLRNTVQVYSLILGTLHAFPARST